MGWAAPGSTPTCSAAGAAEEDLESPWLSLWISRIWSWVNDRDDDNNNDNTGEDDEDVHLEPVPVLLQHPDVVAVLLVLLEQSRVLVFELVTL